MAWASWAAPLWTTATPVVLHLSTVSADLDFRRLVVEHERATDAELPIDSSSSRFTTARLEERKRHRSGKNGGAAVSQLIAP